MYISLCTAICTRMCVFSQCQIKCDCFALVPNESVIRELNKQLTLIHTYMTYYLYVCMYSYIGMYVCMLYAKYSYTSTCICILCIAEEQFQIQYTGWYNRIQQRLEGYYMQSFTSQHNVIQFTVHTQQFTVPVHAPYTQHNTRTAFQFNILLYITYMYILY